MPKRKQLRSSRTRKRGKKPTLANLTKKHNTLITAKPTLTTTSQEAKANGLYVSNETNSGESTYYFRGAVNNNVKFAGLTWKIIRINEDGTVRLILNDRIGGQKYQFNSAYTRYDKMYYSNGSNAKTQVDKWYKTNITDKGYNSYVSTGTFCEQAKVKYSSSYTSGSATTDGYKVYTPNFKCSTDGNGKGVLNNKVGLITYDEVIHAGGDVDKPNSNYYLYNGSYGMWTMSPFGFRAPFAHVWLVDSGGNMAAGYADTNNYGLCPVINLNTSVLATGTSTSDVPYVVQTNYT